MIILYKPAETPLDPPYEWTTQDFKRLSSSASHNHLLFTISISTLMSALTSRLTKMTQEESDSRDTEGTHSCATCTPSLQGSASVVRAKQGFPASQPPIAKLINVVFYLLKTVDQWLHSTGEGEFSEGFFLSSVHHRPLEVWEPAPEVHSLTVTWKVITEPQLGLFIYLQ